MKEINLVQIDISEFKEKIVSYYFEIFPEEERKPVQLIEKSCEKGYTKIIKIMSKETLIGFMILNRIKENGFAILDYLAILPKFQGKGFGTKALQLLLEDEKKTNGIFVEIEKVGLGKDEKENQFRKRRQKFYEALGFKKLNFDLFLFYVIYSPYLFSNVNLEEKIMIEQIFDIYKMILGKQRMEKNLKMIKNLKFEELNQKNLKIAAKVQYEIFPNSSAYSVYKSAVTGQRKSFYVSYIAYWEEKPIGVIGLYEIPEYPDTVWLSWFGLKKEYRKMGFGKQMLDFIMEVAKENHRKYLRLYTFEVWNSEAQKFYQTNMDIGEIYFNEKEQKDVFEGKPKIFSKSLCDEKVELWNNKFIDISEDENSHEKSVFMMKQDKIIE